MAKKRENEEFLEKLAIPLHPGCVMIPDYIATFGDMDVDELPVDEWRKYSKAKYEALKKRFLFSEKKDWNRRHSGLAMF